MEYTTQAVFFGVYLDYPFAAGVSWPELCVNRHAGATSVATECNCWRKSDHHQTSTATTKYHRGTTAKWFSGRDPTTGDTRKEVLPAKIA